MPVVPPETECSIWQSVHYYIPTNDLAIFITEMAGLPFTYKAFKKMIYADLLEPKVNKKDYIPHFRPALRKFADDIIIHKPRMQARLEAETLSFMNLCREKSILEAHPLPQAHGLGFKLRDITTALERTSRSMNQCGDYISLCDRISDELALDSMLDEDFADNRLQESDSEDEDEEDDVDVDDDDDDDSLGDSEDLDDMDTRIAAFSRLTEHETLNNDFVDVAARFAMLRRLRGQLTQNGDFVDFEASLAEFRRLREEVRQLRAGNQQDDDQSMSMSLSDAETSSKEDEVMQDGTSLGDSDDSEDDSNDVDES